MRPRRQAKAIGGFVTLLVFLALVIADTIDAGVTLSLEDKVILLTLVGTLLGLDRLLEQLPGITVGLEGDRGDDE
ncbi:hypothetical protein FK85_00195 [Halorubrum saccharovorum]|uniref:Uncharacterized protein n=1 Tax=Halorubrum saccharovorum TaxID=2248 RepID=A0A081EW00_9EURY|nr:hypothetical protein [Halorubrum saccharovorum]KDS91588.1 hypothetical protein FK85_00195 [Halorubrum saccharovorum]